MSQQPANPTYVTDTMPPCRLDVAGSSTPATTTAAAAAAQLRQAKEQMVLDPAKVRSRNNQLVLAAEDNKVYGRLLAKMLGKAGYELRVVLNGQECLDYLKRTALWRDPALHPDSAAGEEGEGGNAAPGSKAGESAGGGRQAEEVEEEPSPAIILMDYAMPVINGGDATRRIRQWEREGRLARRLPILSMNVGGVLHRMCPRKNPADDTVGKPFRMGDLVEKVDEWVERFGTDGRNGVDVGEFSRLSIGVNCG